MPKMTRTQARRKLNEASVKIMKVHMAMMEGKLGAVPPSMMKKLFPMAIELRKLSDNLK